MRSGFVSTGDICNRLTGGQIGVSAPQAAQVLGASTYYKKVSNPVHRYKFSQDLPASSLDVVNRNAHVTKALVGVFVAIVDGEVRVILSAIVVCEFEHTLAIGPVSPSGCRILAIIR